MGRLVVFNSVSADGYFAATDGDVSWLYNATKDPEWDAFVAGNASADGRLLFGRITYEMMANYWSTPQAMEHYPVVAKGMNELPKFVFSRTLDRATWNNTTLLADDLVAEVRKMKSAPGKDIAILGSGSIVSQLAKEGLIDEYQFVVTPVVLGEGRTMFYGISEKLNLKLTRTRTFNNGNVLLCYEPRA